MMYADCYAKGVQRLEQAGIEEAKLDARLLLEAVCHTTRQELLAHGEQPVTEEEKEVYFSAIEKRASHIPLQQITGEQDFMGLTFAVNDKVLIPRQDTEVLVEEVLRFLHDGMRILDLCTGSGCILLSLLHYSNDCRGVGTDLSAEALSVARQNAQRLGLLVEENGQMPGLLAEQNVPLPGFLEVQESPGAVFAQGDLFAALKAADDKFDVIVSNPPYIRSDVIPTLMEEVRLHEPGLALDGGEDGLVFYRRIVQEAPAYLNGGGMLFLEIGYDQAGDVSGLLDQAGFHDIELVKDFAGNDRVVYGTWYSA